LSGDLVEGLSKGDIFGLPAHDGAGVGVFRRRKGCLPLLRGEPDEDAEALFFEIDRFGVEIDASLPDEGEGVNKGGIFEVDDGDDDGIESLLNVGEAGGFCGGGTL